MPGDSEKISGPEGSPQGQQDLAPNPGVELIGRIGKQVDEKLRAASLVDGLSRLKPGEPTFLLRAQDAIAPQIVREWAQRASQRGMPKEKFLNALRVADAMDAWADANGCKIPD